MIELAAWFSYVNERDTPASWATPTRVTGAPVRPTALTAFPTAATLEAAACLRASMAGWGRGLSAGFRVPPSSFTIRCLRRPRRVHPPATHGPLTQFDRSPYAPGPRPTNPVSRQGRR